LIKSIEKKHNHYIALGSSMRKRSDAAAADELHTSKLHPSESNGMILIRKKCYVVFFIVSSENIILLFFFPFCRLGRLTEVQDHQLVFAKVIWSRTTGQSMFRRII
jgi:hypothetical protein